MTAFAERRWTSADGLSLHARDYPGSSGDARLPVICLHGLTRNSRDFEEVAPRIAHLGRRVIVPDTRGRGLSDWDPNRANYVPKIYVRDLLAMLDALGIGRAVFLGTSMGGIVTMALAASRPRAVAAAILNDVGPAIAPEGIERIKGYVGGNAEIADWEDAAGYSRAINEAAFPGYSTDDWDLFARRIFREKDGRPQLDYDPAIAVQLREGRYKASSFLAWMLFRRLARGRPTLLIRGELSDLLSRDIAKRMKAAAPAMQFAEVPGVGHAPMLTEAEAEKAIEEFLARVP